MSLEPTLFELSRLGSAPDRLPKPTADQLGIPANHLRDSLPLPEISELQLVRHYQRLARLDRSPDIAPQFTGSCTMKYNPKVSEAVVEFEGLRDIHPYQPVETLQGALAILWQMQRNLAELTGLPGVSLQPASGAQGMLAGMLMIKAYFRDAGQPQRDVVIFTDSAHGSNPATATMGDYKTRVVKARADGCVDLDHLQTLLDERVAVLMLTNPNTAGVYERDIQQMAGLVHQVGAFIYLDGANMNALAGITRPADLGVDTMQINLHKTFATPHGGSGPGSGPILSSTLLEPYLPLPIITRVEKDGCDTFTWVTDRPRSIGRIRSFAGNWSVILRAYAFMSLVGADGIVHATEQAVLNANYLKRLVEEFATVPLTALCAHEFVVSAAALQTQEITIEDIAKRLMDYGLHPPLYNFPKNLAQAMLIEPAENEGKPELEAFATALNSVWQEAEADPELLRTAPHHTPVGRIFDRQEAGET